MASGKSQELNTAHLLQGMLEPLGHTHYTDGMDESASQPGQSQQRILPEIGFIGRRKEMAELRSALDEALSGRGQLVMLVGEPGIGKTRTAQETAAYAAGLGVQVLWGRCYEGEGAPPYWPWVQPLRSYVRSTDPDRLASMMGAGAADIAEIVLELRDALPYLEPPPELEPEQARFRLFNSISTFLNSASQDQPLMIILDDLHWADRSSLLLLEFVAQEIRTCPAMILGTYRDVEVSRRHPLAQTLGNLVRENRFTRVQLRGLSPSEVAELMGIDSGDDPIATLTEAVHGRTEGNPFFVNEVIRALRQGESKQGQAGSISIPEGVKDAIGRRLNSLSEDCNSVLATASVIGREFDLSVLNLLTEPATEDQLLALLDEALEARVIEELPQVAGRYQFSHALIQETLTEELSLARRVRLHGRIGEAMEDLWGADAKSHAAELAHHFAEAPSAAGDQRLVLYSQLAGEQALAAYAHEEALRHFQRALDAKEGQPMDAQTAFILAGLGRAQAATFERHRIREVMATLGRAVDYFAQAGEVDQVVAIAEYPFYPLLGQRTGNAQLIASALALVTAESPAAGRLLSRYGRVMGSEEGDYPSAQQAFTQALAIAQRDGNPTLEMGVLAEAANVDMLHARFQETLDKSGRAIELARQVDDPQAEALARYSSVLSHIALGDLGGVSFQSSKLLDTAERLRDRFWLTVALRSHEDRAHLVGDWPTARGYSDRGLAMSPAECRNLCTRTLLEYQTGNYAEGDTYLQRLVEVMRQTPAGATLEHAQTAMVIPLVAHISGEAGLLEVAEAAAATVLGSAPRVGDIDWATRTGLGLLAADRNDATAAQKHYPYLLRLRGTLVLFGMIATDRVLGLLAQTMGNLDQAVAHFEEGLSFCRRAGYRPELGWVCCDYAGALLQRASVSSAQARPGDREKARSLLEESRSIAVELGMPPLKERSQDRLDLMAAPPVATPSYPAGLSQREVEVLRLIAAGRSNREIAGELFISINTVANHVRNILTKTATANRAEAAVFAISFKLMES